MKIKKLRYFALIPALLLVIGAGCGKTATNTNTTAVNDAAANTNETAEEIDTSDWLTYENEEYGFSFKYPSDWMIVNNTPTEVSFRDKVLVPGDDSYSQLIARVRNNENNYSLEEFYEVYSNDPLATIPNYFESAEPEWTTIDGVESVQFLLVPGPTPSTLTAIPKSEYIIEVIRHNDDIESLDVYKTALKTFAMQ